MHEELIDTQTAFYVVITIVDVIAFFCCIYLAHVGKLNNVVYRIGLVILSFGLVSQVVRSSYYFAGVDLPYSLSMIWGLKDIGIFVCLVMVVFFRKRIFHNE